MPRAVMASSLTMPAVPTCFCTSARCNHQASIPTTSRRVNGSVSTLKAHVKERPGLATFAGRAEIEGDKVLRWLGGIFVLALIVIAFAVYSDIRMTSCATGSFFAILGWCTNYR